MNLPNDRFYLKLMVDGVANYGRESKRYLLERVTLLRVHRFDPADGRKARYKIAALTVSLNLATESKQPARWVPVRLVFSAPVRASRPDAWVVFLCTEPTLEERTILQAYSLRWSIEVYYKEIKQHLGLWKEQSGRYQIAYASVHLAALRYLLLFEAMLRSGRLSYGEIRDRQSGQIVVLTYAALLWQLFRALIEGALESLVRDLGRRVVHRRIEENTGTRQYSRTSAYGLTL